MDEYLWLADTHTRLYEALYSEELYSLDGRVAGLVVDGEKEFDQLGISSGFVHIKDKKNR